MLETKDYLNAVAYVTDSDIEGDDGQVYLSKHDNSYVGRVGMSEDDGTVKYLRDKNITMLQTSNGKVSCLGFCSEEGKWYGWSHRAIYGFGVGSEVSKGDCAYSAATPEDLIESHVMFWSDISDERTKQARDECQILEDRSGIRILHSPTVIRMAESVEDAVNMIEDDDIDRADAVDISPGYSIIECGKGEWTAKTMDDAKQMARDFAEGVS